MGLATYSTLLSKNKACGWGRNNRYGTLAITPPHILSHYLSLRILQNEAKSCFTALASLRHFLHQSHDDPLHTTQSTNSRSRLNTDLQQTESYNNAQPYHLSAVRVSCQTHLLSQPPLICRVPSSFLNQITSAQSPIHTPTNPIPPPSTFRTKKPNGIHARLKRISVLIFPVAFFYSSLFIIT